ncbi:hypothetical protein HDU96_011138, partial [Phlyctochytrium bullatum]
MLYANVKSPFTPTGKEEIRHEDEKSSVFSAGAVIKTNGEWRRSPRAQRKDAKADPRNDAVNYGRYVGLVGFAASTYVKVINELNQAYLHASVGEHLHREESARGLKGKDKVSNTLKFSRLLLLLSFADGDVSSSCGAKEVSAEDFLFTPNTPFIAFRVNGEVKVRFMQDVPGGNCFSANMPRWHFIVIEIAKVLWRLAGLDDVENEMDFQAEFEKAKFKPKPEEDDLDDDLDDKVPSLGRVFTWLDPFNPAPAIGGQKTKTTTMNVDDNPDLQTNHNEEESADNEELPELDDGEKRKAETIAKINEILEERQISLEDAKADPPGTTPFTITLMEVTLVSVEIDGEMQENVPERTIEAVIALTDSERKVVDLMFQDRQLSGEIRTLKRRNLSIFNVLRDAVDRCLNFSKVDDVIDEKSSEEGLVDDESGDTADAILSPEEQARAAFVLL